MIDERAEEWDRYCERNAVPEGEMDWLALTWQCDDIGCRISADDMGWAEFLIDELPNVDWEAQRQVYAVMASLDRAPVVGKIDPRLVAVVEMTLSDEAYQRYVEEVSL